MSDSRSSGDGGAVQLVIEPRARRLDEAFTVRRALPSRRRRMVGPFIFLDQMGPSDLRDGVGLDVRPHPHIGLATLTYLFEGQLVHRDGLGTVQTIRPGAANWMTAGRGIAHSERTPPALRRDGESLFGIQCWLALPKAQEERVPDFVHHGEAELPAIEGEGVRARLIAGELEGLQSPITTYSPTLYADVAMQQEARYPIAADHEERALYVVTGVVAVAGRFFAAGQLVVLRPGAPITVAAETPARLMLLGGETMDGPRHIWWNFVSSSRERIEQAKADWRAGRFAPVPEETDFIPLPDEPTPAVRYP